MRKTPPFRLYIQILIFSALVALGALILLSLQRAIQGGLVSVRDGIIARLEQRIARTIRYSSISPSLFGSFDVHNVRITGDDELPVLTMSRFRVAYSLFDLLRGRTQAIHSVRIDVPIVDFNTARDQDLIDLFTSFVNEQGKGPSRGFAAALPRNLMVGVHNGKFRIQGGGGEHVQFEVENFNAEIAASQILVDSKWNIGVTVSQLPGKPVNLQLAMRLNGLCQTDMKQGEGILSILSIGGDMATNIPTSFIVALENNTVALKNAANQVPFDFSLVYGIDTGALDARFDCEDLLVREFLSFSQELENASQLLDVAGSGSAYLVRGQDGSLDYSVDIAGAVYTNNNVSLQTAEASYAIKAAGDAESVRVSHARFSMPETGNTGALFFGGANFSGSIGLRPFTPNGVLSLRNFSLTGTESLNGSITVSSRTGAAGREIQAFGETIRLGTLDLNAFRVLLQPAEHDLGFTVSVDNGAAGSAAVEGSLNSAARRVEANLRLDSFPAADLDSMTAPFIQASLVPAPLKSVLGGMSVTTEVFLSNDNEHLVYNAPSFVLNGGTGKEFRGVASLSGTGRRFSLSGGRLVWGDEVLLVSGRVEFAGPEQAAYGISFSVNANYRDFGYNIEGAFDGEALRVYGPYGFTVNLSTSDSGGYAGDIHAENFPVPFLGQPALLSCAVQLRYTSAASWFMNLEQLDIADITSPAGPARLRVFGTAGAAGAVIPVLYYADSLGPLNGSAEISWSADYSGIQGTVTMREGVESYRITGALEDRHVDLAVSGTSMRLNRVSGAVRNTVADGDIHLSWDGFDSFNAEFNLPLIRGRIFDRELSAEAAAIVDNNEFTVSKLRFSLAGLEGQVSRLRVDGETGKVEARAALTGFSGGKPVNSSLTLEAGFDPVVSWLAPGKALNSFAGKVNVEGMSLSGEANPKPFEVTFSRSENTVAISGGPRNMFRFRLDPEGNFYVGVSSPSPVRGTVIGSIKHNTINARCGDLYIDAAELFKMIPKMKRIYASGGYINAAVDIKGSLTDPEFFGTARGTSMRVRIPGYMPSELRPIPFTIVLDGNEMRFGPVATAVGSGAGTVTAWFRFDRWIPNIFSIDIAVPRETPVPYTFTKTGFTARGDTSGKLNVSMENGAFDISGDLYGNNTELGVNYEEYRNRQTGPFSQTPIPFAADLTITTGPVVEFFYPTARFPILRANPAMGTVIRISADSQTRQFSINSDVNIRGGEIFYFERSFYIRSGLLTFRENERQFAPRLTARAEVRDRGEDGPVTVSMIVDNAPLLSFTARFESNPPLSQMEIFALLGHNVTGDQTDENGLNQRAFLSSTSDLLAQFMVVRQLEQQVGDFMQLDMFSVRTQVLQNAIFMATGLTQTPVDRSGGVGNYFDNTTLFGGKYIGEDMFIQGMLSMRYDENKTDFGGLTFMPDIGVELQNPLFRIRWDFSPAHPENWYVNDNSITLSKSWTF